MKERSQEQQLSPPPGRGSDAFEALVRLYEKRVFALTLRMCGNPEDAAEAAQETFLAAWQGLAFFRGTPAFPPAVPSGLQCLRGPAAAGGPPPGRSRPVSGRRGAEPGCAGSGRSPQDEAERRELRESIDRGLEALTPEHRQVLVLREIHQLRYDEIADVLSLDVGTVKSRISRARKQLRKFLLECGNFSPPSASNGTEKEG